MSYSSLRPYLVFSKKNLGKCRELIDESVKDEKKELEHLFDRLMKEQKDLDEMIKDKDVKGTLIEIENPNEKMVISIEER